jgi:hypothetical protein
MPSPLSAAASLALMALVALLSVSTITPVVDATALTYNVAAHERACFYAWNDTPKKKIAFYFAVRISHHPSLEMTVSSRAAEGT